MATEGGTLLEVVNLDEEGRAWDLALANWLLPEEGLINSVVLFYESDLRRSWRSALMWETECEWPMSTFERPWLEPYD